MITNLYTNSTSLTVPAPEAIRETTIALTHESLAQMGQQIAKKDAALRVALEALELPSMKTQAMLIQRDAAIAKIKEAL